MVYDNTDMHRFELWTYRMKGRLVTAAQYEHTVHFKPITRNGQSVHKILFFEKIIIIRLSEEPLNFVFDNTRGLYQRVVNWI